MGGFFGQRSRRCIPSIVIVNQYDLSQSSHESVNMHRPRPTIHIGDAKRLPRPSTTHEDAPALDALATGKKEDTVSLPKRQKEMFRAEPESNR